MPMQRNQRNRTLLVDKSDKDRNVPHDYVELLKSISTRYLRVENIHMPTGSFALSDFRVFGLAKEPLPEEVRNFKVNRAKSDPRNAQITWKPSAKAYGYNIWYGVAPGKLYNCITVNGENSYNFRGMDNGTTYYFSIEALSEAGRSKMGKEMELDLRNILK